MKKIPTIFERDWDGDRSKVTDTPTAGCEWVFDGQGIATRKYDGTCVMYDGEQWWARREVKDGKQPPPGFVSSGHDHITLKNVGWEPIEQSPFVKYFREAADRPETIEGEGTYELIGPKIQGNPEGTSGHWLVKHESAQRLNDVERTYVGIRTALASLDWEGIVFHHEDGRMAKIKARDFGIVRDKP